jgi:peptidoglycan/xylan/chitin deacetylase (PgdA/CDA1 family)
MDRDFIGYGEHPPKVAWPDGARIAVSLVVNYEEGSEYQLGEGSTRREMTGELPSAIPMAYRDPHVESAFEYGSRAGVWRLLRIFDKYQVKATFYASAVALEVNPQVARALTERGHDICGHGYRWEEMWNMDRDTERERIRLAVESIRRTSGQRPLGWYPRVGGTENTRQLLVEEGEFLYDSDEVNDDIPYFVDVGSQRLLIVPHQIDTNDAKYWHNGFLTAEDYFQYISDTFDVLYEEGAENPKMMSVVLHCRISGRPGRAKAVDRFLRYARQHQGVWFARRGDIARWWLERHTE